MNEGKLLLNIKIVIETKAMSVNGPRKKTVNFNDKAIFAKILFLI